MQQSLSVPEVQAPARSEIPERLRRRSANRKAPSRAETLKRETNIWARRLHVYSSMLALLVVLFFGATGVTLNHPTWTLGAKPHTTSQQGTFPFATEVDGQPDLLSIAEYVRSEYGIKGQLKDHQVDNGSGSMTFTNPGYSADVFFDLTNGSYEVRIEEQGLLGVMNDLHKGRDAHSGWNWLIDLSGGFLVLISITGLIMQLFLAKRRTAALLTAGAGVVITIAWAAMTLY